MQPFVVILVSWAPGCGSQVAMVSVLWSTTNGDVAAVAGMVLAAVSWPGLFLASSAVAGIALAVSPGRGISLQLPWLSAHCH